MFILPENFQSVVNLVVLFISAVLLDSETVVSATAWNVKETYTSQYINYFITLIAIVT